MPLHGITFPYHDDPILHVESMFFLAEAELARGEVDKAQKHYRSFLDLWGNADWDIQAVERARSKVKTLSSDSGGG